MKQPSRISLLLARWRLRQRLLAHGVLPLCVLWGLILCVLQNTPLGSYVDINITQPFLFKVREALHKDPPLHPRLKILSYDDGTVDRLQRADLTIDDWATVLAGIAAKNPRLILIDKVFSIIFDPSSLRQKALETLASIKVPIVVGAFASQAENKTRVPLDLGRPEYQLEPLLADPGGKRPDFRDYRGWHIYGPHAELAAIFRGAGHLLYPESGMVSAFLQPSPSIVVPHLTLLMERRTYLDGALYVNGIRLPTNARGQVIVNFSRQDSYYDRHTRLGTAVLAARKGEPVKYVEEGDTVLILPEMYTGSTDFKSTPVGIMPGGFVLAAMLNSVLTNQWLGILPGVEFQIIAFCMLGLFWGTYRKSMQYWLGLISISLVVLALGVYLFVFQTTEAPLPAHLLAFCGTSLVAFADRNQKREQEARRIENELNDAAEMAKAFRPDETPVWQVAEIAAYHRSFSEASGDWYAFCQSANGRYNHFVLCDVTGHGVQAALMVSICKTVLALYTQGDPTRSTESASFLANYARELNSMLLHHGRGRHLLTMLGVTFDTEKDEVHFLSAGHPPPVVIRKKEGGGKQVRQVAIRSTMLGLVDDYQPKVNTQKVEAGDEILAYTDGLPIGHHVRPLNQFLNAEHADFKSMPEELLRSIWEAETRKSGRHLEDDVSIVWFRVLPLQSRQSDNAGHGLGRKMGT